MKQQIIMAWPPMIDKIDAAFGARRWHGVIFSWGDKIYSPHGTRLSEPLLVHEHVHGCRQLEMGVEAWWEQYIADRQFRYSEELLAHAAEYAWHAKNRPGAKQEALRTVARRLCSPLYGRIVPYHQAKVEIEARGLGAR